MRGEFFFFGRRPKNNENIILDLRVYEVGKEEETTVERGLRTESPETRPGIQTRSEFWKRKDKENDLETRR